MAEPKPPTEPTYALVDPAALPLELGPKTVDAIEATCPQGHRFLESPLRYRIAVEVNGKPGTVATNPPSHVPGFFGAFMPDTRRMGGTFSLKSFDEPVKVIALQAACRDLHPECKRLKIGDDLLFSIFDEKIGLRSPIKVEAKKNFVLYEGKDAHGDRIGRALAVPEAPNLRVYIYAQRIDKANEAHVKLGVTNRGDRSVHCDPSFPSLAEVRGRGSDSDGADAADRVRATVEPRSRLPGIALATGIVLLAAGTTVTLRRRHRLPPSGPAPRR